MRTWLPRLFRTGMVFALLLGTGCWDRKEINDIAIVLGTGLDAAENGLIRATIQVAVPSPSSQNAGGTSKEADRFFLVEAVGKNGMELDQMLQQKMSRTLFFSHRSVILIGEELAKRGIGDILDTFNRSPRNRLTAHLFVVKGATAEELLKAPYPYELAPAEALKEMEALLGEGVAVTLRDYMIASASEGLHPTVGVLEPTAFYSSSQKSENKLFKIKGTAILKADKLEGFLTNKETHQFLWFKPNKKTDKIIAELPDHKGNVGYIITHRETSIRVDAGGVSPKFRISLKASGNLFENNSPLDISSSDNLKLVKETLEQQVRRDMSSFLEKIQTVHKADIVGFGQQLERKNPKKWKQVKSRWDELFARAELSVSANVTINNTGAIGPPLQYPDKELVK